MIRNRISCLLLALLCMLTLPGFAAAAQVDSGAVYCFSREDFSEESSFTGICITALPQQLGAVMLGSRVLQPGDILTGEQVAQMTFSPIRTEADQTAEVCFLPIYENHVGEASVMTISIRGREDKAPIAEDLALETYKNLPNTGKLKVTDPEGQAMTFTVTRQPKRGTVTIGEDGSFTYTPKKNKVGVDSFTFTAADPAGNVSREATVTINILKPSAAAQYTDTVGRDCRFAAEWMKHTGIFLGEKIGDTRCFHPDKTVTRGEFVTMLVNALEIPVEESLTTTGYTDEIPLWLQPYLAAAVRSGLTAGLPDQQTFGAGVPITGAEVSVLLTNALDLTPGLQTADQADSDIPVWAQDSVMAAVNGGFRLNALQPVTREEAALLLYQAACALRSTVTE